MSVTLDVAPAAYKLCSDIMKIKKGEQVAIMADSGSDPLVVNATAEACAILGAKPTIVWYPMTPKVTMDPTPPAIAAMNTADVVIEFCASYFFYGKAYEEMDASGKTRYLCLTGMNAASMIRSIGKIDVQKTVEFGDEFVRVVKAADEIHITTDAGTDLVANNRGRKVYQTGGIATQPGTYMLIGQVAWNPVEETMNGTIAVDGWEWNVGFIDTPIKLSVKAGRITDITGGREAKIFSSWLSNFNDPNMYRIAHYAYGINPGILKLTGTQNDDERIFGTITFGVGTQGKLIGGPTWKAAAHDDMGILNPTVTLDKEPMEVEGKFVHPKLKALCKGMGIPGY